MKTLLTTSFLFLSLISFGQTRCGSLGNGSSSSSSYGSSSYNSSYYNASNTTSESFEEILKRLEKSNEEYRKGMQAALNDEEPNRQPAMSKAKPQDDGSDVYRRAGEGLNYLPQWKKDLDEVEELLRPKPKPSPTTDPDN